MGDFPQKCRNFLRDFSKNQRGATGIEYAMIASGIFLAIVLAIHNMNSTINATYEMVSSKVVESVTKGF